jgi:dsRNA-specific ribonuclease
MPNQRIQVKPASDLEHVLEYKFKKKELLLQALTHASAITEKHPMASVHDLSSLAFVGDAMLKYAVARYLFLNGRDDVIANPAKLHEGVQAIITNHALAKIARDTLRLEEYLIRGNGHKTLNMNIYADCMEAIFGAIALDCGNDQQQVIFGIIEKLCADRIGNLLVETTQVTFASTINEDDDEWIIRDIIDWSKIKQESASCDRGSTSSSPARSCLQTLSRLCLWFFAAFGFIIFWCVVGIVFYKLNFNVSIEKQWYEL